MRLDASKISDEEFEALLNRYFDGEATPDESLRVEVCLEQNPERALLLGQLVATRSALRQNYQARLEQADFSGFWEGIEAGIETLPSPQVTSPTGDAGLWGRLQVWIDSLGWQALGAGAIAAIAMFFTFNLLQNSDNEDQLAREEQLESPSGPDGREADEKTGQEEDRVAFVSEFSVTGVRVDSLAGGENATVMVINAPDEATIIWIQEDDPEGEGGTSI